MEITPNYIELAAHDLEATTSFYEAALGFEFTSYGPDYAAVEGGPVELGFAAGQEPSVPMPTLQTDDLDAALQAVTTAGATIVAPPFDYPGGRRFEFLDPSGNRIAIYKPA